MLTLADSSGASRARFDQAIRARNRITLLVLGDDDGLEAVAADAEIRAQSLPEVRQVVWVRDLRLLSPAERSAYTRAGTAAVCALTLDDRPAAWLDADEARDIAALEDAFLAAEEVG
jgi:hypothetical protein